MIKGKISITRPQGHGCDYISIEINDEDARIQFCDIHIKLADFATAITGLYSPCEFAVRGLENVGKKREHKTIEFPVPGKSMYSLQKEGAIEAAKAYTPEGWIASEHYGSQDSCFMRDGQPWARTTIFRWIEKED